MRGEKSPDSIPRPSHCQGLLLGGIATQKFLVLLALITLIRGVTFAQTQLQSPPRSYRFQSIDFRNATTTQAFGISERGGIVGSYVDTSGTAHGFSLINGRLAAIDFPGAIFPAARGINDSGTIAGGFTRADDPNGAHGFVLDGQRYNQVDFPDSAHSGNLGINEAGDLTGSYDLGDISTGIGFYTANGKFI